MRDKGLAGKRRRPRTFRSAVGQSWIDPADQITQNAVSARPRASFGPGTSAMAPHGTRAISECRRGMTAAEGCGRARYEKARASAVSGPCLHQGELPFTACR